jgi:hypothetical protein
LAAWFTLAANFSICTWRTKTNRLNKRCTQLAACMKSNARLGT